MSSSFTLIRQQGITALSSGRRQPEKVLPALRELARKMRMTREFVNNALQPWIREVLLARQSQHGTCLQRRAMPALHADSSIATIGSHSDRDGRCFPIFRSAFAEEFGEGYRSVLHYQSMHRQYLPERLSVIHHDVNPYAQPLINS